MDSKFKSQIFIAFAALYLIWGSTYLAIRFVVETLPPFSAAGLRFLISGSILYGFSRLRLKAAKPQRAHWKSALIVGSFLLMGGNGLVVWAEKTVPSGLASLLIATVPLWMILLEWLWLKEKRPSAGIFFGITAGFAGVWLLMAPDFMHFDPRSVDLAGVLAILIAALSWAAGSVYSRRAPQSDSPFLATGMQMMMGGIVLTAVGMVAGEWHRFHLADFSVKSMAALAYLTVFGSLFGFTAYIWLLKHVGVARASTYAFVNPIVAVFLGWVTGETLSANTALAAVFIVLAVLVIILDRGRNK